MDASRNGDLEALTPPILVKDVARLTIFPKKVSPLLFPVTGQYSLLSKPTEDETLRGMHVFSAMLWSF